MQTSSTIPVRFQPDATCNIPGNDAGGDSITHAAPHPKGGHGRFKVKKRKPDSNFADDNYCVPPNTYSYRQLESCKLLRERISKGLDQKFDGTLNLKTLKRDKYIKSGCKIATATCAITCTLLTVSAVVLSAGALLPSVATNFVILTPFIAASNFASFGFINKFFTHNEKYYLDRPWFQYFVDEQHRALFLKEVPEHDDITALEDLVGKIRDKLSSDQINETYKDMKKKIGQSACWRLRQRLDNQVPFIFNVYLELAKQRYASHH